LAKNAPPGTNPLIWSGRAMHRRVQELTEARQSFVVETTLSGNNHFRTVQQCKKSGYKIALHFVYLSSLQLAIQRVKLRVSLGGHDVSEADQERRYSKSLSNAARLIEICDEAFVYNNDGLEGHQLVSTYLGGKPTYKIVAAKFLP
jgi:predicted ABC-type ATPase